MSLSKEFYNKLNKISSELGMNPRDLLLVMYFESGINPNILNHEAKRKGEKGAIGLIQFMPETLKGLGVPKNEIDTFGDKSAEEQLDWVKKYIQGQMSFAKRSFKSASEYYHANFFPLTLTRWKGQDPIANANVIVVSKDSNDRRERSAYNGNKGLDRDKDGHITVADLTGTMMSVVNRKGFQQALAQLNSVAGGGEVTESAMGLNNSRPARRQQLANKGIQISVHSFLEKINECLLSFIPAVTAESQYIGISKVAEPIVQPLEHSHARDALREAYKRLFNKNPSDGELDFGLATSFFESGYGRAGAANWAHPGQFARWASENKFNWGALQSGVPGDEKTMQHFKSAGLHPTKEKGKDAGRNVYFYLFPNDVEAAMAFLMSWGKPDTLKAAASGSSKAVSKSMKNHNYYEGFWVPPGNPRNLKMPPFKEAKSIEEAERNNITDYASALNGYRSVVTGTNKKPNQQMAIRPTQTGLDMFLSKINEYLSSFASYDSSSKFLVIVSAEDYTTKAEYARILQSVLQEELKVNSAVHYSNDSVELNCFLPYDQMKSLAALTEVCSAVSDAFELATKKIGGCQTSTVILPERVSLYPEMDIKIAEINRRKFKLKIAKGSHVGR